MSVSWHERTVKNRNINQNKFLKSTERLDVGDRTNLEVKKSNLSQQPTNAPQSFFLNKAQEIFK